MYNCIVVMVYMYIIDSKWRKEEMVELREKERATYQLFMSICTCTQYITCILHVHMYIACILHVVSNRVIYVCTWTCCFLSNSSKTKPNGNE